MQGFRSITCAVVLSALAVASLSAATPQHVRAALADPAQSAATRVVLELRGETGRVYPYASLTDACGSMSYWNPGAEISEVKVLDYSSFGSASERYVDAGRAYFLIHADKARGSSDALNIIAFSNRADARRAQRELGGDLRDFKDAWQAAGEHWQKSAKKAATGSRRIQESPQATTCFT